MAVAGRCSYDRLFYLQNGVRGGEKAVVSAFFLTENDFYLTENDFSPRRLGAIERKHYLCTTFKSV